MGISRGHRRLPRQSADWLAMTVYFFRSISAPTGGSTNGAVPWGKILVMEQAHAGQGHDNTVLVSLFDDQIIADGAAGLSDVLNAGSNTALDGVSEGDEGVGTQSYGITGIQPCPLSSKVRGSGRTVK